MFQFTSGSKWESRAVQKTKREALLWCLKTAGGPRGDSADNKFRWQDGVRARTPANGQALSTAPGEVCARNWRVTGKFAGLEGI